MARPPLPNSLDTVTTKGAAATSLAFLGIVSSTGDSDSFFLNRRRSIGPARTQPAIISASPIMARRVIGSPSTMDARISATTGLMKKAKDALAGPDSSMAFIKHTYPTPVTTTDVYNSGQMEWESIPENTGPWVKNRMANTPIAPMMKLKLFMALPPIFLMRSLPRVVYREKLIAAASTISRPMLPFSIMDTGLATIQRPIRDRMIVIIFCLVNASCVIK